MIHLHFIRHFVNRAPSIYLVRIYNNVVGKTKMEWIERALSRQLKLLC